MIRQAQDRPSVVERTLEAVARQDGEQDSRRRQLFMDESRRTVAINAEPFVGDSPNHPRCLPSGQESTNAFADAMAPETIPARSRIGREGGRPPRVQPELALVGAAEVDRYLRVKGSFAPFVELSRSIAHHAGPVEGITSSAPSRLLEAVLGAETHRIRPDDMTGRDATTDALARLAPRYTMPLNRQLEGVVLAQAIRGREAELTNVSAAHLTSSPINSPTELGANEREFLAAGTHDGGRDHGFRSPRIAYPRAQADGMIANDLTHNWLDGVSVIGANRGGLGDMIGQGDLRANSGTPHPTIDRFDASKSDDGPSSNAATSGAAQDAMAAAAGELERLRTAVRRTIDELERVRGSVQPPLPSLPVNRGAFRIS